MKTKQLLPILFFGILFFTMNVKAQNYQTAVGLRFGGLTNGLTIKHFVSNKTALEGIVSFGQDNFVLTGLFEKHTGVDHSSLFNLYYGIGGHVGFFRDGSRYYYQNNSLYYTSTVAGIDGILGLGYKFQHAPINIGMDFKPFIDFYNGSIIYFDGAVSVRYTF